MKMRNPALTVGLLALMYSGIGCWRPSFWTDEAATLSAVRRSFPDLIEMLGHVDSVHGAYYVLLFGWTRVFGFSELSLRLPSVVAIALAAFVMVRLGAKLGNVRLGVLAAALMVVLPRTQYSATDARSYALTVLGAVTATYLLVSIRENPRAVTFASYAVVGAVTVGFSFYCIFLFAAHTLTSVWDSQLRKNWRGLLAASVGWLLPAGYIGVVASQQQFQISWIPPVGPSFLFEYSFLQFFGDGYFAKDGIVVPLSTPGEDASMYGLAVLMWIAAAVGVWSWRGHFLVRLSLPWLVVPAIIAIGGSLLTGGNYYLPRYLTFTVPALALLAAAPLGRPLVLRGHRARRVRTAAACVAFVLAVPSYVGQRTQFGRDPADDFRFIATAVGRLAEPAGAFVMSASSDLAYQAYPDSFRGLGDPTRGITAAQWKLIYDQRFDVASSAPKIIQYSSVILVEKNGDTSMARALEDLGYAPGTAERGPATTVTRFSRRA